MKTLQFEAVKVALKQDKTGYVLTLCMHPDEIPEELLRDFVGARYQVVMVRLSGDETPMDRGEFDGQKAVRVAGLLCRDPDFWTWLHEDTQIIEATENEATDWLRDFLGVASRSELKVNKEARDRLEKLHKDFNAWKRK
jgi:hypothetical protein